ncbi:hypothetical protein BDP27DRAFT_1378557 [Rhodocollybia butyracea]|uniref:Retrotransposon gag domain-containing protein n=1 Tax=Rhodocollybia butyracea TaxID=206335 RepID=A0A9P5P366_9AGAR|nr:hypothetical protein BDP27DRAFT_1378557 [Rhodocollybia butyracea]
MSSPLSSVPTTTSLSSTCPASPYSTCPPSPYSTCPASPSSTHPASPSRQAPSPFIPDLPPHLFPLPLSTPFDVPCFKGPVSPTAIIQWVDHVTDSFDAYIAFNGDTKLTTPLRILYAGLALEDERTSAWWLENRTELKVLATWEEFAGKVLEHFAPNGWKVEALRHYHKAQQGTGDYEMFAADLQSARAAIGSSSDLKISNCIHINHHLFFANETLQRHILAIPSFDLEMITINGLINIMTATWNSLIAERLVHPTVAPTFSSPIASSSTPSFPVTCPPSISHLPPLDDAERKCLSDAHGCWKCRKTPTDPGDEDQPNHTHLYAGAAFALSDYSENQPDHDWHDDIEASPPDEPETDHCESSDSEGY